MKPVTSLPWEWLPDEGNFIVTPEPQRTIVAEVPCQSGHKEDGAYIVHAANAYPEMVAVFRGWKCPACGGSGEYLNHSATPPHEEIRQCRKCTGSGLDPRATALLGKLGEL